MRNRTVTTACILLFTAGALLISFVYGPLRRSFASPARALQVSSSADIYNLWQSSGVRGRIAVLFTRHLNVELPGKGFPEVKYIEHAMRHGIVRTVYYVVPDTAWTEVVTENLQREMLSPPKPTESGFVMFFEEGRVNVLPLSRFWPMGEESLIVLEAGVWSRDDLAHITRLIRSRGLTTDLLAIIRGSLSDVNTFNSILSSANR